MASDTLRAQLIGGVISVRLESARTPEVLASAPAATWAVLADRSSGVDLGARRHFELRRLADLSEIYLRLFLPPEPWQLDQLTSDGELVWTSDASSFADVLVSSGPAAAVFSRFSRSASARLLDARVPAVRLVKLAAPRNSLLRTSRSGPPALLSDSELWFGPGLIDPTEVVTAGIGGAS